MPAISVTVDCPVQNSFRVQQVAAMFDLPVAQRSQETFTAEVPGLDEPWTIGAIVGPSGSGKSTLARAAFGNAVYQPQAWPAERAIVDALGEAPIQQIAQALIAVGLGSPPAWIKPYAVLSNGEKFRCDLARALLQPSVDSQPALVVFDEFTSVVDRTVARFSSAAVSRALRREQLNRRFVAATCHYDVLEWLEPDWVLDLADGSLSRRRLRRPRLCLQVGRCSQAMWRMFARHHYLSGRLSRGATCYVASWKDRPIAFCAVVAMLGKAGQKRISRIVTFPDYQGLGIGARLVERVCEDQQRSGWRIGITASHPAVIGYCRKSPRWRFVTRSKTGNATKQQIGSRAIKPSAGRGVASFEFIG